MPQFSRLSQSEGQPANLILVIPWRVSIPVLAAPTASGKTAVALELSDSLPLEVISADAMMVYQHMDIGTAKPTPAEQARLPHHVIDVVAPDEPFSVADYVRHAETAIEGVLGRGSIPFVLGGAGFYIRALTVGLPTVPEADMAVQAPLWKRFETEGIDPLMTELCALNKADAERAQRNPRRVIRALEIWQRTGRSPADFPLRPPRYQYRKLALLPKVSILSQRIAERTHAMVAGGLIDEVRWLLSHYPTLATARQAIGYREVTDYLMGNCSLDEAIRATESATVQYAKRQRTWFRKEPGTQQLYGLASDLQSKIRAFITQDE
jgi:tRNA dimethylallyltransferase